MKAWLCREFATIAALECVDLPRPEPGPGQVRVAVRAASLNFPDALIVQGKYQVRPPLPFVPGSEFSGVIDAVGEGVTRFHPGQRVIALAGTGGFAEAAVVPESQLLPLPDSLDFIHGAALVFTYGTSLWALRQVGQLQAGESLLILGAAGGVGSAAIQLAKLLGAQVLAAASSPDKLTLCTRLGADHVIDYSQPDWREAVQAITGKKGLDMVYDAVGGAYSEPALRCLGWHGRFLVVGFAAGDIPRIPLNLALLKERRILGVYWGDSMRMHPEEHARNMQDLASWSQEGRIAPSVSQIYPFSEVRQALQDMASRKVLGKVVVQHDV